MSESNPFEATTGLPSISFATRDEHGNLGSVPIGTEFGGKVTKAPTIVQQRGYEGLLKDKPLFWDNLTKGKTAEPKDSTGRDNRIVETIVVHLNVAGEEKGLWVTKYPKYMFDAIGEALAGRAIEVGDELYISLKGFIPQAGKAAAKDYSARFIKGQGAFAPETPVAAAAPAPAVAPPAPPAPPAPAAPLTVDGFTKEQWISSGYTEAHFAADPKFSGFLTPAAPAAPPAPPAAPAAADAPVETVEEKRARALAAMSPEDRAALGL